METSIMVITQEIFEAFLRCPTKSYLYSHGPIPTASALTNSRQQLQVAFLRDGVSGISRKIPAADLFVGTPVANAVKQRAHRVILDCIITTPALRSRLHGMELTRSSKRTGHNSYVPLRFVPNEKISGVDKLVLAFDAFALSHLSGGKPQCGKVIHGTDFKTTTVPLTTHYGKLQTIIASIGTQNNSPMPPPLVLNKHCAECDYQSRCHELAKQADDLSLLAKMTGKERLKHHERGIFTVTQLSYTFRPRRRHGTVVKYDHALRALAIRKDRVHVIGDPKLPVSGTPVYFDVEGDPDRSFYYCIGMRYEAAGTTLQRSFWADDPEDERMMWTECLRTLKTIDNPRLVHYGSYEITFLRQMKKRHATGEQQALLDQLIASAVNILSIIYAQVYFPTYSNGLKDVAGHLGFRWSQPAASGLLAINWRRQWEYSKAGILKQDLLTYNAEDCAAAQLVAEAVAVLTRPSSASSDAPVVDVNALKREYPQHFGKIEFSIPEFEQINNAAHWDHQREKVYVRLKKGSPRHQREAPIARSLVPINKIVECDEQRPKQCPRCHSSKIYKFGRLSQVVFDLKLSGAGIKRWVVRYSFHRYICWQCKATFHQHARQCKYGNTFRAYIVYHVIELQLSQHALAKSMRQLFKLPMSGGVVNHLKVETAARHEDTYRAILKRVVTGQLVHADETRVSVSGKEGYVWVFTNLEDVAFIYSDTREASTARDILQDFRGVLVSDFYSGYDAIPCAQQKCLIHLMRDMNDDLAKQPFNDEMKELARQFATLLRAMVESVDRFGLKTRHLRKHRSEVDRFYATLSEAHFQNEIAAGYQRRFEKNRDRLFTFLDHDGVPWNNNNAEHAIKSFVRLRNIIGGTSTAKGIREYLVLLSISETCKFKGASVLDFFLSEEDDVDTFVNRTRRSTRQR
jgi:predicted RecB family nuclease